MRLAWLRPLVATLLALLLWGSPLSAQELAPAQEAELDALVGRPLAQIEIVSMSPRWSENVVLRRVRPGQIFSRELARLAMQELLDSGRVADARAEAEALPSGVLLRLHVLPRRIVASVGVAGSPIDTAELLEAAGLKAGSDVTEPALPEAEQRARELLRRRGYPNAQVFVQATDTDDPIEVVLDVDVAAGRPLSVEQRWFAVWPDPHAPGMRELLASYAVREGEVADETKLAAADRELTALLIERGYHRASVSHAVEPYRGQALLRVIVDAGPLIKLMFEGNRHFDASDLEDALELDESSERSPSILLESLRDFYVEHGFYDAEIRVEERGEPDAAVHALVFSIREGTPLRVVAREYPCLTGPRGPAEVGSEIDSFLSELPGGALLDAVDEETVAELYGPRAGAGRRKRPLSLSPWTFYVPEVYERAIEHLQNLFRSEGYLSASVGPPVLLRRACDRRSPPGQCIPKGPRRRPRTECRYDEIGLPLEEPALEPDLTCKPDPAKGLRCESEAVLHLPIKLGPRSYLKEISFEGNETLPESTLFAVSELSVGAPASQVELDKARRRMLEAYAEEGFVFAEIEASLELSHDHTQARARFVISERDRVRVSRIDLRGARLTSERLIRSRVALKVGQLYRLSLVRKTEERLATLGVFSSVSVGFEDPYVPAREKVVVITLEERKPQRLDVRPGFSTGEGFRISFEYGHNNVGGQAIGLTLRSQLAYLPDPFIFEADVRRKYDTLDTSERIERRNTITVEFPEIGLGPLFRLSVEGVDVRDNARDYGLTRDAAIVTLTFRPDLRLSFHVGGSLELNDVDIFGSAAEENALGNYLAANSDEASKFRVPDGTTVAIAQRIGAAWDRRDRPLDATSGTFLSVGAEHVNASPVGDTKSEVERCRDPALRNTAECRSPFLATDSDFMRYTNRVAGYVRLSRKGLALATSFRWGFIQQLRAGSRTYPDRLFFLGGGESVRGFAQDSLVPEDIAQLILSDPALGIDQVLIRGGDIFVNPRAELRVPLTETVQTALFLDAGNLWADISEVGSNLRLRYAVGSGIRVGTPIGPLVFDYGFNVDRVLDGLFPERPNQRTWESLGAFHFSIGLF